MLHISVLHALNLKRIPLCITINFPIPTLCAVAIGVPCRVIYQIPQTLLMLEFLSLLPIAQIVAPNPVPTPPPPTSAAYSFPYPREVLHPQEVRPLPGQLDTVPVFNSNSPELVQSEGVLLSTFPPDGMPHPAAHLNYPLQGRFDVFAHHVARGLDGNDVRTVFLGILVHNPTDRTITLDVLQAASYLSQEAPFHNLPAYVANPLGNVFAGPGSRTTNDVLRGQRQSGWPERIVLPPRSSQMIVNHPIPLRSLESFLRGLPLPQHLVPFPLPGSTPLPPPAQAAAIPQDYPGLNSETDLSGDPAATQPPVIINRTPPTNGRSVLMYLSSDGPVYLASLSMYARINPDGSERAPTVWEWAQLLTTNGLVTPRDIRPTPPDRTNVTRFFYGRVAGIAQGSQWNAQLTDSPEVEHLSIPPRGQAISYGLSMLDNGTFGTGQVQSAPMLARYPDTAYRAHGNYGIHYNLTIPLRNSTEETQTVGIMIQTPIKQADYAGGLRFLEPPSDQVFFRGTVRVRYPERSGAMVTRYFHIVQRQGQVGEPLLRLTLPPGDRRTVQVDYIYPPDSTPPQVITIQTLDQWSP